MNTMQLCFCGSHNNFSVCCQPFIEGKTSVNTAEQLMRSRFSAYAIGNAQYVYDTYAKSAQVEQSVEEIAQWGNSCVWIALIIHPLEASINSATEQFVEFSAFYISNNTLCELREKSRFILEKNDTENKEVKSESTHSTIQPQWRYIDGDIITHNEIMNIKRNELCPCNRYPSAWSIKKNKKFKHCCGK